MLLEQFIYCETTVKELWLVNSKIGIHRIPVSGTTWRQFCTVSTAWTAAVARVVVVDVRVGWTLLCMFVGYGDIFSTKFQFWISIWTSTCEISGFKICWMSCWDMNTFFLESASARVKNKFPQPEANSWPFGPSSDVLFSTSSSRRGEGWTCKNKQLRLESIVVPTFFSTCNTSIENCQALFCFSSTNEEYKKGHDIRCWGHLWVGDSQRCWRAAGNPRQHHQRPRRPNWST